jgi:hypothetical protein
MPIKKRLWTVECSLECLLRRPGGGGKQYSDGDSSSADGGRPQYSIRNIDSSFDSSGAGAESASSQGKSDVAQSRQDGGFYPTRGRVAQNERDKERDEETERGVYCS